MFKTKVKDVFPLTTDKCLAESAVLWEDQSDSVWTRRETQPGGKSSNQVVIWISSRIVGMDGRGWVQKTLMDIIAVLQH